MIERERCVQLVQKIGLFCSLSASLPEWYGPARGSEEWMSHRKKASGTSHGRHIQDRGRGWMDLCGAMGTVAAP